MQTANLQNDIQTIIDNAVEQIRNRVVAEVSAALSVNGTKSKPKRKKPKRPVSPEVKKKLMNNLQKAWVARSKNAAERRKQGDTPAKKNGKRPSRTPARKKSNT